jgi:hypothetical protein
MQGSLCIEYYAGVESYRSPFYQQLWLTSILGLFSSAQRLRLTTLLRELRVVGLTYFVPRFRVSQPTSLKNVYLSYRFH